MTACRVRRSFPFVRGCSTGTARLLVQCTWVDRIYKADGAGGPVVISFSDIRSAGDGRVGDGPGNIMMSDSALGRLLTRRVGWPRCSMIPWKSNIGLEYLIRPTADLLIPGIISGYLHAGVKTACLYNRTKN